MRFAKSIHIKKLICSYRKEVLSGHITFVLREFSQSDRPFDMKSIMHNENQTQIWGWNAQCLPIKVSLRLSCCFFDKPAVLSEEWSRSEFEPSGGVASRKSVQQTSIEAPGVSDHKGIPTPKIFRNNWSLQVNLDTIFTVLQVSSSIILVDLAFSREGQQLSPKENCSLEHGRFFFGPFAKLKASAGLKGAAKL